MTTLANTFPERWRRSLGLLLIVWWCWAMPAVAQVSPFSLLTNGDFEQGNGVGFSSNYNFLAAPTGNTNAGQYGVGTNPQPYNTTSFASLGDRTTGTGRMLIVDGTNNSGNPDPFFWRVNNNGEICGLTVGAVYTFSYWVRSIYNVGIPGATPADIRIKWNNVQGQGGNGWSLAPSSGSTVAPAPGTNWTKVTYNVIPTNACIRIEMFDLNGDLAGNDFALDDIELIPPPQPLRVRHSQQGTTCPGATDGFIAVYGSGGTPPYSYSFNGGAFGSTNLFSGLAPGTYTVAVRDASLNTISSGNITIADPTNPLAISPASASICAGQSVTFTASGGYQNLYAWASNPADGSMTFPTPVSLSVQPTVTTTYTVRNSYPYFIEYNDVPPPDGIRNLVYNHNFNLGDSGFYSDYTKLLPNTALLQTAYAVVSDPRDFESTFSSCPDFNANGDKMLVVDGATSAGKKIWCQKMRVLPNTQYGIRYWIRTVAPNNPAQIAVQVNGGIPIVLPFVTSVYPYTPSGTVCGAWERVGYFWNSGSNTEVELCFINQNLNATGNDFAIDNIQFGAISPATSCQFTQTVTVTVSNLAAPVAALTTPPNCTVPFGTITVSSPAPAAGIEYRINGGAWQTGNIFSSLVPGSYDVEYRQGGCNSAIVAVVVPPLPVVAAPTYTITAPTCLLPSGTITITSPLGANFSYRLNGAPPQTSPIFSGLPASTYSLVVVDNGLGCQSAPINAVMPGVPLQPTLPTATVTTPANCTIPTATITISSPAPGPDIEYSIGGIYQDNPVFTVVAPGTSYNVTYRFKSTGCISVARLVPVDALPTPPPAPVASVTVHPTCLLNTGTLVIAAPLGAGYEYRLNSGAYQSAATFTGLVPGSYTVTVREIATGCTNTGTAQVVNTVPAAPPAPVASVTVQPTCVLNTGTLVITAPLGAGYEYRLNSGAYQSTATFTGLAPGSYTVTVRQTATGCTSTGVALVVNNIPAGPPAPSGTVTQQPNCANPQGSIVFSSPLGAGFEYRLNSGGFQANPSFNGLVPGSYTLSVREIATGCTTAGPTLTISALPTPPAAPTAGVTIQPTCNQPQGTVVVSAPLGLNLEYNINGGGYQPGLIFTNRDPGTQTLTVRDALTGCVSAITTLTVNAVPPPPAAPIATVTVQPTCALPTGTIVVTSPLGAGWEYSVGGAFQTSPSFAGLTNGVTYQVVVRQIATGCISASLPLTVNTIPGAPAPPTASVTIQPTCLQGATIVVSAPLGAGWEYSIGGAFQSAPSFTALNAGVYNVTVRSTATGCVSSPTTLTAVAPPVVPTPVATVTQPTCAANTGSVTVTSPTGPGIEYRIDGGPWQTSPTFASLPVGPHAVGARNVLNGCTSTALTITINAAPAVPASPVVLVTSAPTCANPAGTFTISAPVGASLEYSKGGGVWQASPVFVNQPSGSYTFIVRNTTSGCISPGTTMVMPPAPSAPLAPTASITQQPGCSNPTGTIVISSPTGPLYDFSIDGVNFQTNTTFANLAPGTYNVVVREINTGCVSLPSVRVINAVPALPPAPTASVTAVPTCAQPAGTITITAPVGSGWEYSVGGAFQTNPVFPGLTNGTSYNVVARNTSTACTSLATVVTMPTIPGAPASPVAAVSIAPTCAQPAATVTISSPSGAGWEYSSFGNAFQTSPVFTNLQAGTTVNFTVRNTTTGCVSAPTAVAIPSVPAEAQPVASVTSQPSCANPNGNIVVTQPNGVNYEYSLNGGPYQNSNAFPGLAPGNYSLTARNKSTGCVSIPLVLVVSVPGNAPAPPTINIVSGPTCSSNTVAFTITAPLGPGLQYSINGGTSFSSNTSYSGVAAGTVLSLLTRTTSGCTSAAASVTLPAALTVPPVPVASVTAQPTCLVNSGTITVTAPLGASYTYSIGGAFQASPVFANVAPGSYTVSVLVAGSSCISSGSALSVSNLPTLPPAPQAVSPVSYCQGAAAQPLQATGTGLLWYNAANGGTGVASAPVPGTSVPGTTTWYVSQTVNGCESPRTPVRVDVVAPPLVNAGPDATINAGGSTTLQASATGTGLQLRWLPPTGLSNASILQPIASPSVTTTYRLTASLGGCTASDEVTVFVRQEIVVPNAFSPNGDGTNDVWLIRNLETFANARVRVYDRYGRQVYDNRNTSGPWAGTNRGGPAPSGVYYYIIDKGDGSSLLNGSVTLVR